ncbi:MAG: V-type ATPase subunit [Eubacterium sp.]|nr:V-type ATPase subunit [Eubacterium sp.]
MGDVDYAYAVARIRVRERYLLSDADVQQMIGMKDEKEVLAFLIERGWGEQGTAEEPDAVLSQEEKKIRVLMKELKVDPEIFEILSYPEMYHNLKAGIKAACISEAPDNIYYDIEGLRKEDISRILQEKAFDELPAHMREAAKAAYERMIQTRDGQRTDVLVDRACLEAMDKAGSRSKVELLRVYEKQLVAVRNIKIAVRSQKTGKSLAFLQEALAPCHAFNVQTLAVAAASGKDELFAFLSKSGFSDAAEALQESPSAFEKWCDDSIIDTIRPQKRNAFSAGPVIAYYLARVNEISTARIILTAKANGFSEDFIRERVRKMYG